MLDSDKISEKGNTLRLEESISRTVAELTTLELKTTVAPALQDTANAILQNITSHVTEGLLHGSVILKPYFAGGKMQAMAVKNGDYKILERDESTGKPTVVEFYERQGDTVRVERHTQLPNEYVVMNFAMYKGRILETMPENWKQYRAEVRFPNRTTPLYGYFSTTDGMPFCEKARRLISEAEAQFSRLLWEFESGNRALYVADTAFFRDKKGEPKLPDKRLYRLLCTGKDDLFCDYSPAFRQKDIIEGLNCILQRIEDCCALSRGTLSDANLSARTATELKIMRHRTYATVKTLQRALEKALYDMLQATKDILSVYGLCEEGKAEAVFHFDDSVLTGKTDEISDLLLLLDKGVLTPQEVRSYLYGEKGGVL